MGFSRQWSGLSLHSSRGSSLPRDRTCVFYVYLHGQVGSLPLVSPRKPSLWLWNPFMEGLAGLCTPAARIALTCTGPHLSTTEALFFFPLITTIYLLRNSVSYLIGLILPHLHYSSNIWNWTTSHGWLSSFDQWKWPFHEHSVNTSWTLN